MASYTGVATRLQTATTTTTTAATPPISRARRRTMLKNSRIVILRRLFGIHQRPRRFDSMEHCCQIHQAKTTVPARSGSVGTGAAHRFPEAVPNPRHISTRLPGATPALALQKPSRYGIITAMAKTHSIPASQAPVVPQPEARNSRGAAVLSRNLDTYGALGLALFCLATSKWGSYLIPGPPYISDLIIMGLIANRLLLLAAHRRSGAAGALESTMVIVASLLLSWTVLRLAAGGLSIDALRDAVPFMYCVVVFLVVPLSDDQERFTAKAITAVLGFQLVWTTFSAAGGGQIPFMPEIPWAPNQNESFRALTLFGARPDFDVAVLGMFAALSLHRALSGRRPLPNLIVAFWALSVIGLGFSTTAGFLAVAAQMGVVVVLAPARKRLRPRSEPARHDNQRPEPKVGPDPVALGRTGRPLRPTEDDDRPGRGAGNRARKPQDLRERRGAVFRPRMPDARAGSGRSRCWVRNRTPWRSESALVPITWSIPAPTVCY